jgi:hypothetical protein
VNFREIEIEKIIPLFAGVLVSLFLCALAAAATPFFRENETAQEVSRAQEGGGEDGSFFLAITEEVQDPVLEYFRDPEYKEWVIVFFAGICSNRDVAQAILNNADEFNVPPSLAFALSWEESKFNPRAVNRNRDGSVDRGLFQLNNRSFPHLEISDFFSVRINARSGIGHLRHCLDSGGSEISALAMYNAGTGRVTTSGAPKVTLDYISRILENRGKIESRFHAMLIKEEEERLAEKSRNANQPHFNRTLTAASPL